VGGLTACAYPVQLRTLMQSSRAVLLLVMTVIVMVTAGCRSPSYTAHVLTYDGQPPVWVFIPLVRLFDQDRAGFAAEVALPPRSSYSTNRVAVQVRGCVVSPGEMRLPEGCTVLQAVSSAGGFTDFAFTKSIRLTKRDGTMVLLTLNSRRSASTGRQLVWYGDDRDGVARDYVLEDGDKVEVRLTM